MRIPLAQMQFIRDIQHSFGKGVDPDVLIEILLKFALIATPLVILFVIWHLWDKIFFYAQRSYYMRKNELVRTRIAQHLKLKRVVLEIYVLSTKSQQFIGRATVVKFGYKKIIVGFVSDVPNALSRVVTGKRVICYCKPFKVGGQRINSFHSYILRTKPGVAGIKSAVLLTPAHYIDTVRRSSPRKRVAKAGAVKVKLWGAAKRDKFMVLAPDFETGELGDAKTTWKAAASVVNISAGGLKFEIHPKSGQVQPKVPEQVVLEILILNPAGKSFTSFTLLGAVRSVVHPRSGAVRLGIQFLSIGERTGSRAVNWKTVQGDVEEIAAIIGQGSPKS